MPRLIAVHYRILEGEQEVIVAARNGETHDFGGELVLHFEGGARSFVSWVSEPVQYAIGSTDQTHFLPTARFADHDLSASPMWRELIGKDVTTEYIVADNQVLRISSGDDYVLVCSFERGHWWADELTICKQAPAQYDC